MINQPEERPLSIGSAVQFTHKGKTIHGHLLQRQGRRRFAKIVDTEERTWNVPESALKHSGGARRVTIITRHDNARAAYRVGDEVTFTSPDGPRRGSIVKLNPKSAQVRCGKTCWNVSYGLLRRAGRESARNGAERLNGVAGMARRLMDEHGLTGWTLAFGEARKRLGDCHFRYHVIRISRTHALEGSEEQIRDTVLHEIAHAIAGHGAGHGPLWKATARRIGATPRAKTYESQTSQGEMMSLPAMTNQSASHRGIANQIDTTTRFCNAQVIKTCREPDRCVTGRLRQAGKGAVRRASPCVVSRV